MSVYPMLLERLVLPVGDALAGQRVTRHLASYAASQYWPAERLREEQDRLLRETVATAVADVPFYRELYARHGVGPNDIRGLDDLPRLPTVDKVMLRAAFPDRCTRRTAYRWHDYSTSGSTGRPFVVRVDDDTMSRSRALMMLRTMYAGWRPGLPTLQTGMSIERGRLKSLKDHLMRVSYVSAFDLSDAVLDGYLELIDRRRIQFLTGYAQSLYLLARRAREVGFNRAMRAAVTWGSNMLDHYRREIRVALGCEVFDSYGVGEGMQIAAQCGADHGGYHQFCLHVACEVCNSGAPVPPGTRGEFVLTRLDAGAMPLIRYRVGDVGSVSQLSTCPCGRTLPLLHAIDGRTSDIVVTPRGNHLIIEFFNGIFQYAPTIELFQVLQESPAAIHVKIVTGAGFEPAHWERVRREILARGDPDLGITMEIVDEIPLEASNKRRYVKSTIGW